MNRLVVGITGASGVIYGIRLLEVLRGLPELETHLIMSPAAAQTIALETNYKPGRVADLASVNYRFNDITAAVASGSYKTMGMIVVPCSVKTLAGIAHSYSDNLLLRAADVTLKERRPLVIALRETPLHVGHLRLMVHLAEIGAVIAPCMPAFYHRPQSLDDLVNQTVNRLLDQLNIDLPHDLFTRWAGAKSNFSEPTTGEGDDLS